MMMVPAAWLLLRIEGRPAASGQVAADGPLLGFFDIATDLAILGIGTGPNQVLLRETPELTLNKWGYVQADPETGETEIPMVFAGGDIVTGAATVVLAMGAGRKSAREIARRLGLL